MYYDDGTTFENEGIVGKWYGTPRHSGRYPWGSGENPYQHTGDFLATIKKYKDQGYSETEIAKLMNLSTTQFRIQRSVASKEQRRYDVARAKSLAADGKGASEIGREMGINESTVRSLLNEKSEARMNASEKTAEILKKLVDEHGMIDVGVGVERELGISKQTLDNALYMLRMQGYEQYGGGMDQVTNPGQRINMQVLCPPGTKHGDIYKYDDINMIEVIDEDKVTAVKDYHSTDGGLTYEKLSYPKSIDSSRIEINYGDQGGKEKDGVIELRRGVEDISLGNSQYAQVRIAVDGTHYLKGMAMYTDDLPDGVDVRFNTNKPTGTPKEKVFKELSSDPTNPFGANIKDVSAGGQRWYPDANGNMQLSVINKVRDEGDWDKYSDSLSSQFLSKQNLSLIKKQLNLTYANSAAEFEEISNLTNPTVKRKMLLTFAEECDGAAVHLKAAGLPRQSWQVILPVPNLSENEIYAPNYRDGETVALIRYPHGGTFEIPILKVNNKQKTAKNRLQNATDAVGINSAVAERLSGADFDGDTVLVIPMSSSVKITSSPKLKGLEGFDPKIEYSTEGKTGVKLMSKEQTGTEMGKIANLVNDMTLKGATPDEVARAVRHSMVVIDAAKHKLDYKKSFEDNGIAALKKKYQGTVDENGHYSEGASTLISRAKSKAVVPERRGSGHINPDTGEVTYNESGREYQIVTPSGKIKTVQATHNTTKMAVAKDARTLSSGTQQEELYADYANKMKALANAARKEYVATGRLKYSPEAKQKYQAQVDSLDAQLNIAMKNHPRERAAQRIANVKASAKKQDNPEMSNKEYKKIKQRELTEARTLVGAKREPIHITDLEWEAIQAGAISDSKLAQILNHTDSDAIKKLATPKSSSKELSGAQKARIKAMFSSGYTTAEIADAIGISTSTVSKYANSKKGDD